MRPWLAVAALGGAAFAAAAQTPAPSRGELLYTTHCISCHSQQMHWRDKRLAVDWPSLRTQVALWQERAVLGWTGEDITQVAAYLNDTIYRYPRNEQAGGRTPAWPVAAGVR